MLVHQNPTLTGGMPHPLHGKMDILIIQKTKTQEGGMSYSLSTGDMKLALNSVLHP